MRTCVAAGALAIAGLLAAGCSSGPVPAASHPAGVSAGGTGSNTKTLYISCLQAHGVHIPDPVAGNNGGAASAARGGSGVNRNSPQFRRAERACVSLRPRGTEAVITTQEQVDYLRAAQCMRAHGVPEFPDPVFSDGGVNFPVPSGVNTHSPQVQRAVATCRRLIPQGLPYSR
jgi:hypothetical protein